MTSNITLHDQIMVTIKKNLGKSWDNYRIPPPVFGFMQAEFVEYDPEKRRLAVRFPILENYLNPYGAVQGGILAAAVDNALGPLSVLVAPPNLTRRLEMTYSKPVKIEMKYILVEARFIEQVGQSLVFAADVRDPGGVRLARAKATHWIIAENIPS
jgi:acyl-coenzyme A thioesterase PaaI-like protein